MRNTKLYKQYKRKLNDKFQKNGRTPAQIKRKAKKNQSKKGISQQN